MHRVLKACATAVAAALVLTGLEVAAPALTQPAAAAAPADPGSRPDAVSAAAAARASGQRVEVTDAMTETRRRWVNPEGTTTDELYAGPVRVRRGDGWAPIDTTLSVRAGKVVTAATIGDVTFSAGGAGALATMAEDGVALTIDAPGHLPAPVLDGAKATYVDVMPGVDVELTARPSGFEQSYVVKSPGAMRRVFRLTRTAKGLEPATTKDGQLVYVDARGEKRAWVGAARMWDVTGRTAPVQVRDIPTASGRALEMTPDAAFLDDPSITYPVTVDPVVQLRAWHDAYISSTSTTTNYGGNAYLKIGLRGSTQYVSYIKYDLSDYASYTNRRIIDVTQSLGVTDSVTCSTRTTTLYKVTSTWSSGTVTWASHPTTDLTSGGVLATATSAGGGPTGSTCAANAWMNFNDPRLTDMFQDWAWGTSNYNYGMSIRSSSTDSTAAKDFASAENTSWTPRVTLTYNTPPYLSGATVPYFPDLAGFDSATQTTHVKTSTPSVGGQACDEDRGTIRPDYEVWDSTGTTRVAYSALAMKTEYCTSQVWRVPSPLADGAYKARFRAYDGTDYTAWSGWRNLVVDTVAPGAPTVSSTAYPAGSWAGVKGQAGTFNWSATGSPKTYYYGLDDPLAPTAASGTSASITPPTDGPHTLYVKTVDLAGNISPTTAYSFNVGDVAVTGPVAGARTEKTFTLQAAAKPTWTSGTWKWRRSDTDSWADLTGLKDTGGNPVSQPLAITSGAVPTVTWDAEAAVVADGPFQLALDVTDGTATTTSDPQPVSLSRTDFASVTATEAVGPGSANLQTGNLQLSATDVSVAIGSSDLSVSRTFNSRAPQAEPNGPFGPGWVSSVPVEAAGSDFTGLAVSGSLATVTMGGGDTIGFTKKDTAGNFTPEYGAEDLKLKHVSASDRYDLTDLDGNVTGFTRSSTTAPYVPTSVQVAGDTGATTYAYETVSVNGTDVTRVTGVMARTPAGVTGCSLATPSAVVGCRSLQLTYAPGTTTAPGTGQVGDYPHRLVKVEFTAYDPTPAAMATVEVAHYAYDASGRLAQAWNPRLSALKTTYTYNASGQVETLTPPAEESWTLTYADRTGESGAGRLRSVSRPTLLTSPATATTTVVYGVPLSGTGAPWDLSPGMLDRTGQADRPVTATALFPPTTTTALGTDANVLPTSWDRAEVHYLNADGREVNSADAAGAIATTEYDGRGNVVRALTPANRQRALDGATAAAGQAQLAQTLSTLSVWSGDGMQLRETFGPERTVTLSTGAVVRAREHTVNTYDEGAPTGTGPHHLLTKTTASARVAGDAEDTSSETRTTRTQYGTTAESWALRLPTATIIDSGAGSPTLTTRMTYTTDGRILTETLPAGGTATNTAATRVTRYYSAGADAVDAACGNKPAWVGMVCSTGPGGQPAGTALPTTYRTYTMFGQERVLTEKNGATTLRTTSTTYDAAGRPWKFAVAASTGTAVPNVETYYDANGRPTQTRSLTGTGITATVSRTFDSLGRVTSYTDADGNTSTTTYDVLGRPVVTTDGKGTQTRTYDGGTERRGLLTSLQDSQAGTWTATYDVAGTAAVTWPNGLLATTGVDETGSATSLTYAATTGCTSCTVFTESIGESVHDQWLSRMSTLSAQEYAYDNAGRLTQVADTVGGSCTTRKYTFDAGVAGNSNRTKLESFSAASDGSCQTSAVSSTADSSYDAADRLTTTGTVYDSLGRTTTVPDADALDSGALTVGYHANDLVRSIGIAGGGTKTYTLDVDLQRVRSWTDGTTTRTNHYDGDADSPAWTQEGTTAWTRNIGGITGDLAAVYDSATSAVTLQLTNLHGDVVATTPVNSTVLASTSESTEFGAPRGATGTRYGWLGGKQRAADTPSGVSLMGVRVYNPATGRFLQVDPVYGGNANAYTYPLDPMTQFDLDGRICWRGWVLCAKGGKQRIRDTGLVGLSNDEVRKRARDTKLPGPVRERYKREEKARGIRPTGSSFWRTAIWGGAAVVAYRRWGMPRFRMPSFGGGHQCARGTLACTR